MFVSAFVVWAVIGGEDDQGIVVDLEILQQFEELAHVVVHHGDHGGEAFLGIRPVLVFVNSVVGNLLAISSYAARFIVGVRDGPMHMEKEGLIFVFTDELETAIDHFVVGVGNFLARDTSCSAGIITDDISREFDLGLVLPKKGGIEIVSVGLIHVAEPVVESVVVGMSGIVDFLWLANMSESPFSDASGGVSRLIEFLGDGHFFSRQPSLDVAVDFRRSDVLAKPEDQPRWAAHGVTGIVIGKLHAL